jgi:hypothetical protein
VVIIVVVPSVPPPSTGAVVPVATQMFWMHDRPLVQSKVRVHDWPAMLVPPPVSTFVVLPHPTAAPTIATTPMSEPKTSLDMFMSKTSLF